MTRHHCPPDCPTCEARIAEVEPAIFQGRVRPIYDSPAYTPADEEAEIRRGENRYESWLYGEKPDLPPDPVRERWLQRRAAERAEAS